MNKADSDRLGSALDSLGLSSITTAKDADVVVLNSCVVRQSAEDKVVGTLGFMKSVKRRKPGQIVALMGCMVGVSSKDLEKRFPHVDVFMRPQEYGPLIDLLGQRMEIDTEGCLGNLAPMRPEVSGFVPIIHGCDLMCTFCIIPFRRGRQVSRPISEIANEVELMTRRGMREVTLLGQTVDAYGHDLEHSKDLSDLLHDVGSIRDLLRVRFLTSHPQFMSDRIIDAVAEVESVCEHINLPVQAGDDWVLSQMRRRYTTEQYRRLVDRIRTRIPGVSISTDIIVGFPGETGSRFQRTVELLEELQFDKVHLAAYSPRPGTFADNKLPDDVPLEEKRRRLRQLEELQKDIQSRNNARLINQMVEVLVDGNKDGKWKGRTRTDRLVFFEDYRELLGQLVDVQVNNTSAWALQGTLVG